jgi:hypothetical protein
MDQAEPERFPRHELVELCFEVRPKVAHRVAEKPLDARRRHLAGDRLSDDVLHVFEAPAASHLDADAFRDVENRIMAVPETPFLLKRQARCTPRPLGRRHQWLPQLFRF